MPNTTKQEGVITIFNEEGELCSIIYKDMVSRKNLFYKCEEMSIEDLQELVGADRVSVKE